MRPILEQLETHSAAVQAIAAVVQVLLAAALAYLTWRLVRVTESYVKATAKMLDLTQKQYAREWTPDLRLTGWRFQGNGDVFLEAVNLARSPGLVKAVEIGHFNRDDHDTRSLVQLIPGGETAKIQIRFPLIEYIQHRARPASPEHTTELPLKVSVVYDCAGRENKTEAVQRIVHFTGVVPDEVREILP